MKKSSAKTMPRRISYEGVDLRSFLADLIDLTKPKLSGLVIITVFTGMLLAPGAMNFSKMFYFLISMILLVGGSAALNCVMEIEADSKMDRTKNRPLPAGRISPALALTFGLSMISFALCALYFQTNTTTFVMAILASVFYLLIYTPLKQRTDIALYLGAVPGALPPLMAWTHQTGSLDFLGLYLFALLFIWQLPHFLAISIYLAKDYSSASIQVLPNLRGSKLAVYLICLLSFVLMILNIVPSLYSKVPNSFAYVASLISFALFILSLRGVRLLKSNAGDEICAWARNYFLGTIIYLPLLLLAMLLLFP
ncbi:heme o synthase [bacterium]|nr:heme o synthase [bacterium]